MSVGGGDEILHRHPGGCKREPVFARTCLDGEGTGIVIVLAGTHAALFRPANGRSPDAAALVRTDIELAVGR